MSVMNIVWRRLAGFLVLAILMIAGTAGHGRTAAESAIESYKVFQSTLKYIDREDFDKALKSLSLIDNDASEIKKAYGAGAFTAAGQAVKKEDKAAALYAVNRLIYWHTAALLDEAVEQAGDSQEKAKSSLRKAYAHYVLISQMIEVKADAAIRKLFKSALAALGGKTPFGYDPPKPKDFKRLCERIKKEVILLFPDFLPPPAKKHEDKNDDQDRS